VPAVQLTRSTDVALRVLMLVGTAGPGGDDRVTVARLATTLDVPPHHLAKIVQRLQRLGLLVTTRGRGGGVRLGSAAASASVGAVVRALEGDGEVVACERPPCPLAGACRLRGELRRAQEAFLTVLDAVRLEDLRRPPTADALVELRAGI
jgi:Rrf2 family nitric oxide-sensitive transcriptional repressor